MFSLANAASRIGIEAVVYVLSGLYDFIDISDLTFTVVDPQYDLLGPESFYQDKRLDACLQVNLASDLARRITDEGFDAIAIDFFPFGRVEIALFFIELIKRAKDNGIKVFSSVAYPMVYPNVLPVIKEISGSFDAFFIHLTAKELTFWMDAFSDVGLFYAANRRRIAITGYVLPFDFKFIDDSIESVDLPSDYILITKGSGIVMDEFDKAAVEVSREYPVVYVRGPMARGEFSQYPSTLCLVKATGRMKELFQKAKGVLSTAGYNTSMLALYHKRPMCLIPFKGTPAKRGLVEQTIRAAYLSKTCGARVVDIHDMAQIYRWASEMPKPIQADAKFDGAIITAKKMAQLLRCK